MQCGYGAGYAAPNPYANGYGWAPQVPSINGPSGCSGYGYGEGFQQGATGTAGMQTGKSGQNGKGDGKSRGKNSKGGGDRDRAQKAWSSEGNSEALSGFNAMSAAASSYVKKAPKQVKAPAEMNAPSYDERNPYRLKNHIRAWHTDGSTTSVPEPYGSYPEAQLPRPLLDGFKRAGFQAPTPIQAQVWPILDNGWDVIGIAKTGSGKTLGFLVPAYRWMTASYVAGIRTLIMAPTRELATQIHDEASKFAGASGCSSACVYGGQPKREQLPAVRAGAPILVATPGRLNDFLEYKDINLSGVGYLVFDEADRMLDMGFEPQIRDIMKKVPRKRQTLMFSATWPEEVQNLAHDFLSSPIHVQVGDTSSLSANEDISQQVWMLNSSDDKDAALVEALQLYGGPRQRVLVFVAMKKQCDMVMRMLRKYQISANTMHSDKDQQQREEALQQFKTGETAVLIATDVAARGLDIKGRSRVINYDSANSTEDHVHRIGRTGRAGQKGHSITFLAKSGEDAWKAIGIAEVMQKAGCAVPPEMKQVVDRMLWRRQQSQQPRPKVPAMLEVLMVAEKPSVAKLIAEILSGGRMRFRKGQSRAVQIYEFNSWFPPAHQQCRIMQTSTIGHVFGLDFKENRPKDIAELFHDPCKKTIEDGTAKNRIVEHFQELAAEADYLALWLDCDKEGENICFEVISLCENIPRDNIYRAQFSALTEPELRGAYNNLGRPDKLAAQAVDASVASRQKSKRVCDSLRGYVCMYVCVYIYIYAHIYIYI
ncbi:RH46 [Symbiodinium necroappetens]|uniref:RNA helicase n=1 Tax=Symbiodinium necroappetens TaxID=1628268 RepID=A0A812MGJ5_9DINO|nr:RH46 [Symbiodinium necroappetens]